MIDKTNFKRQYIERPVYTERIIPVQTTKVSDSYMYAIF